MIGVDTNVLLRLLIDDDPNQNQLARRLASRSAPANELFVNLLVLAELVWTLRRSYRYSRPQILDLVEDLINTAGVVVEHAASVAQAVAACRGTSADFPDALIGALNRHAGCSTTYSFDTGAAAHLPDYTLVPDS